MKEINKLLSFLWRCWFVILATITTLSIGFFLVFPFTFREKDFSKAYYFERCWALVIFYGAGLKLKKIEFPQTETSHPYVIISNHTSMMDIMVMLILNKKPMVFVGKKELLNFPIFGMIFSKMNIVVDRNNPNSRSQVIRASVKNINLKRSICIFPEGGVPDKSIVLDKFLDGPFAIAIINKVPLITVAICGLKEILPYGYFSGKPGTVEVHFKQSLETSRLNKSHIPEIKETCYDLVFQQLKRYNWRKKRDWPVKK